MNERPAAPAVALLVTTFSAAISGCVIPIPARQSAPAIVGRKVEASDLQGMIPLKTSRDEGWQSRSGAVRIVSIEVDRKEVEPCSSQLAA